MYDRILVPLDGSKTSESVLPYVRTLAARWQVPVELLHAIDPEALAGPLPAGLMEPPGSPEREDSYLSDDAQAAHALAASGQYLQSVADGFVGGSTGVTCTATPGKPADVIVAASETTPKTLVAMSTHGRTGIGRWVMGSITDKVLRALNVPLLLVRGSEGWPSHVRAMIDRVLVPLDGSESSEAAMAPAVEMASSLEVPLVLVRVVTPVMLDYAPSGESVAAPEEVLFVIEQEAKEYLERTAARAVSAGASDASTTLLHGFAATQLLDLAEQFPHGILAMSTHGRSGVGRWVLGSVSDHVVRHTSQPVLLIRPDAA